MGQNIKVLYQLLSNNPISAAISKPLFTNLDESLILKVEKVLGNHIERYGKLPEVQMLKKKYPADAHLLKVIFDVCPTSLFRIASDLNIATENYAFVKKLLLIGMTSSVFRFSQNNFHIQLFLKNFDGDISTVEKLNEVVSSENGEKYLPKILTDDFTSIVESHLTFQRSNGARELIEVFYYFTGVSQFFLKYYFDLVSRAPNDTIAEHIDQIFSALLKFLRLQEVSFWNNYGGQKAGLLKKIRHIVEEDSPNLKHPCFGSQSFSLLYNYNPLVQDGNLSLTQDKVKSRYNQQLQLFNSLSMVRLSMFLDGVNTCKGATHVNHLLTEVVKNDENKLLELRSFIEKEKISVLGPLLKTVSAFNSGSSAPKGSKNIGRSQIAPRKEKNSVKTGKILYTVESSRLHKAKKNLAVIKDYKGTTMMQDDIPNYLEERLKRLYEEVKMEGALNQYNIDAYLEQFSNTAAMVTQESSGVRQKQLIGTFKESTNKILEKISDDVKLAPEKLNELKQDINAQAQRLNSISVNKRVEAVEEIGVKLTEASLGGEKELDMKDLDRANGTVTLSADAKAFLGKKIIPIGFEKNAPKISVEDFFKFPLAEDKEPVADAWFAVHQRYLDELVEEKRLSKGDCSIMKSHIEDLPKNKYKRYYNIYPNDSYDDTILMAVLSLFQNNALKSIKL